VVPGVETILGREGEEMSKLWVLTHHSDLSSYGDVYRPATPAEIAEAAGVGELRERFEQDERIIAETMKAHEESININAELMKRNHELFVQRDALLAAAVVMDKYICSGTSTWEQVRVEIEYVHNLYESLNHAAVIEAASNQAKGGKG
jgi:hypothetical protein